MPRDSMELNDIRNYVLDNELIEPHQHIVIGLSGGPDSVCLFHALKELSEEWDLRLYPVHINHQIRPEGAMHDQQYVEELCQSAGLGCRVVSFNCEQMAKEQGLTTEEAGRIMRYRAFDEEAERIRAEIVCAGTQSTPAGRSENAGGAARSDAPGDAADMIRIATAHNADDQVETVLLRLLRGTGTAGLAGIDVKRRSEKGFLIVRPILFAWKEEVLRYCRENGLDPCIDSTNAQPLYARNRVRLDLIPYLQQYNAGIKDALLRLSAVAGEEKAYLDSVAREALDSARMLTIQGAAVSATSDAAVNERRDDIGLPPREEEKESSKRCYRIDQLLALPDAVRHRAMGIALKEAGLTEDVSRTHFLMIDRILRSESPSAEVSLPHGFRVCREYENIRVIVPKEETAAQTICVTELTGDALRGARGAETAGKALFDKAALEAEYGDGAGSRLCLRTRRSGDWIAIPGGRKKLQDLFVDNKVPKHQRDRISLIAIGGEVLWIPRADGAFPKGRFSAKYRVSEDTKTAILVELCMRI